MIVTTVRIRFTDLAAVVVVAVVAAVILGGVGERDEVGGNNGRAVCKTSRIVDCVNSVRNAGGCWELLGVLKD